MLGLIGLIILLVVGSIVGSILFPAEQQYQDRCESHFYKDKF